MSEPFALNGVLIQNIKVKIAKAKASMKDLERVMPHLTYEMLEGVDKNMDTFLKNTEWATGLKEATIGDYTVTETTTLVKKKDGRQLHMTERLITKGDKG